MARRKDPSAFWVNWLLWPIRAAYFRAARRMARKAGLYR
jgi:hypothetical protein